MHGQYSRLTTISLTSVVLSFPIRAPRRDPREAPTTDRLAVITPVRTPTPGYSFLRTSKAREAKRRKHPEK